MLLTLSLQLGPDRYSVDYWLEQRVSWWHKVAEIGPHNHPVASENGSAALTPVVLTATASPDATADENGFVTQATPVMLMATGSSDENGAAGPAAPVVLLAATSSVKNGTVTLPMPEVAAATASPENGAVENGAGSAGLATPVVVPPRSSPDSSPADESEPLTPPVVPVAS